MLDHPFEYVLELWRTADNVRLGRVPIQVDWVPALESLIFDLLRRGVIEQPGGLPPMVVKPIWDDVAGPPTLIGFRATLAAAGGEATAIFSTNYFGSPAQQASCRFVERGDLKEGEAFEYYVLAIPRQPSPRAAPRFSVTQREIPLPIKPASIERFMNGALLFGTENARDVPVFYHWRVLEEASILTRRAGAMETGGVLIGHVCRDAGLPELFLEITALIPARAKEELTRLSFSPDTWTDVQVAVDRRNQGEIWLGWFHSHSFYRDRCDKSRVDERPARQTALPFLSEEDRRLHRVCFPRAYGIALLITDSPQSGMSWTTFGWRTGNLARRSFHVIHAPLPAGFQLQGETSEANPQCVVQ
jgi:proteasome lid subunit RPN8/RPN11